MSRHHETAKIMFLLDQGDWGDLAPEIKKLRRKERLLSEADVAFSSQFEVVERKRKDLLKKRLADLKIGTCQVHGGFNNRDDSKSFPHNIFPLEKLRLVRNEQRGARIMCEECVTKLPPFRDKYDPPRYKNEVIGPLTPEQFWHWSDDRQLDKLGRHFKMPCLRDYEQIYQEAEDKRLASL